MSYSGHVQTKHEIEYGGAYFNWQIEEIKSWLAENDVCICGCQDTSSGCEEWELDKSELQKIPEDAYRDIGGEWKISADDLREFVEECLDAPTGEWAYVSWW